MTPRSLLFVPGNRADRFAKAAGTEADLVCIDLEDAVGPGDKDAARAAVIHYLDDAPSHVGVRINATSTEAGRADIAALAGLKLPFVMVPKVDSADDLSPAAGQALIPVIESARGLLNADAILARDDVGMALFGAVDFSADLDCALDWDSLLHARSHLAVCAAANDVILFDVPYLDVRDPVGCEAETRRVKALGIHARSAIHPAQIAPIHSALEATEDEITQARRVVEASQAAGGNVALLDGKLIEAPLLRRAQRILERS